MLDYHLQGEIRLKEDENSWCLQEFSEQGEQVGEDFEPYPGFARFTASNLTVGYTTGVDNFDILGKEIERSNKEGEHVFGELRPSISQRFNSDTYSLFRTERKIENFELSVVRIDDNYDHHVCHLRGYPSFTTHIDLGGDIEKDGLMLEIGLLKASYDKLTTEIKNNRVDELDITLKFVPGFYTEYRYLGPEDIKVLLRDNSQEAHHVVIPDDCEIDPPRLGEVKEFDITINQSRSLNLAQNVLEAKQSVSKEEIETARWEQLLSDNKESNRFLHEGLNRIIMLLGLLIGMVFILVSIYGFLLIYKQEIPYLGWIGFVILVITFGAFFILFNHLPGKGWGKTETLGPVWSDAEKEQMEQESKWIFEQARSERK